MLGTCSCAVDTVGRSGTVALDFPPLVLLRRWEREAPCDESSECEEEAML